MADRNQTDGLICYDGRTPEEELEYRVDNQLSLRDHPPGEEETAAMIESVFGEWDESFRLLADA